MQITELIDRWNANEGKPYKGQLIDWDAYRADPDGLSCMCPQGQVLHSIGGWDHDRLRNTQQAEADKQVASLLNTSRAHAILLRNVNDKIDGAPSIVLTDPGKVLGGEWSKLLDFWWHMDQMTPAQWDAPWDAARDAAGDDAGDDAAIAAAIAAGVAAGGAARYATWEIQGARILRDRGEPFFFLPLFGFADPDAIPARPADYGTTA